MNQLGAATPSGSSASNSGYFATMAIAGFAFKLNMLFIGVAIFPRVASYTAFPQTAEAASQQASVDGASDSSGNQKSQDGFLKRLWKFYRDAGAGQPSAYRA